MKVYNGLGGRTATLILNILAILKYVYSTFKLARLLYNTVLIEIPYYSRNFLNSFYTQNYSSIIDACPHVIHVHSRSNHSYIDHELEEAHYYSLCYIAMYVILIPSSALV